MGKSAVTSSVTTNHKKYLDTPRFGALDGLRAISVVGVVWYHVSGIQEPPPINQGYRGVDLFFAISGFLITTLLLREWSKSGRINFRRFYLRRTLRIFPVYYLVLAGYCVLTATVGHGTEKAAEFWNNLLAFTTFTSNWFVNHKNDTEGITFYFAWSLATEEQFYLFWPLVLVLILTLTRQKWPAAILLVSLIVLSQLGRMQDGEHFAWVVLASLAPAILMGAIAAITLHSQRGFIAVSSVLGNRWASLLVAAILLAALTFHTSDLLIQFLLVICVVSLCVTEDTLLHSLLQHRTLVSIGVISYGIYLLHMLVANVVRRILDQESGLLVFVLTLLGSVVAAHFSYKCFESPILRWASRIRTSEVDADKAASTTVTTKKSN